MEKARWESEPVRTSEEGGEREPKADPVEQRDWPGVGVVGGKHAGCTGTHKRVNEMPTDSGAGAEPAGFGVHVVGPSP